MSLCRICGRLNGCSEFTLGEWQWPSGLRHYVEQHNVKPSDEFIEFILNNQGD